MESAKSRLERALSQFVDRTKTNYSIDLTDGILVKVFEDLISKRVYDLADAAFKGCSIAELCELAEIAQARRLQSLEAKSVANLNQDSRH